MRIDSKSLLPIILAMISFFPSELSAETKEFLMEQDRAFAEKTAEAGLEGWLSYFANDAVIFPRNSPIIRGIDEVRTYYEKTGFDPRLLSWEPVSADISDSVDLGYTYGYWTLRSGPSSSSSGERRGKYTTVWKKQSDGSWKVALDIGSE